MIFFFFKKPHVMLLILKKQVPSEKFLQQKFPSFFFTILIRIIVEKLPTTLAYFTVTSYILVP